MRTARRTKKYPNILPKAALFLSIWLFSVTFAGMLSAKDGLVDVDTVILPPYPKFQGRVMYVPFDAGTMLIQPKDDPSADMITAKLVGIDVSSQALAIVAINHNVECYIIYETPDFKGVDCLIEYRDSYPEDFEEFFKFKDTLHMGPSDLRSNLISLGLAEHKCSETDLQFVNSDMPGLLQRLCNRTAPKK